MMHEESAGNRPWCATRRSVPQRHAPVHCPSCLKPRSLDRVDCHNRARCGRALASAPSSRARPRPSSAHSAMRPAPCSAAQYATSLASVGDRRRRGRSAAAAGRCYAGHPHRARRPWTSRNREAPPCGRAHFRGARRQTHPRPPSWWRATSSSRSARTGRRSLGRIFRPAHGCLGGAASRRRSASCCSPAAAHRLRPESPPPCRCARAACAHATPSRHPHASSRWRSSSPSRPQPPPGCAP
mmetsp:Transcript_41747/g.83766  ORF Transcript_41747/g.83766 Transcript_41747/m.83766 type:complete len:241 (-) Transcript_41747:139-861(-)